MTCDVRVVAVREYLPTITAYPVTSRPRPVLDALTCGAGSGGEHEPVSLPLPRADRCRLLREALGRMS